MNLSRLGLLCSGIFLYIRLCELVIVATGIECLSKDLNFVNFSQCDLKPVSRGLKEITVLAKLLQKPVTNITVRTEVRRRSSSAKPIYGVQFDVCTFFRNKRRNPLANVFYEYLHFKTHSNLNHSCPFDHDLSMKRLPIDRNLKYLPIDKGEYTIRTDWLAYNVLRAIISVNFYVVD